jgi:hypothetical protein
MLLCANSQLKQKTVHWSVACFVYVLLHNAAKQMFTLLHFAASVIKQILIFVCSFFPLFNQDVSVWSTTLDFPVVFDGQFTGLLQTFRGLFLQPCAQGYLRYNYVELFSSKSLVIIELTWFHLLQRRTSLFSVVLSQNYSCFRNCNVRSFARDNTNQPCFRYKLFLFPQGIF